MENSEFTDPLKETKNNEKNKKTEHQEPQVDASQSGIPESASDPGSEKSDTISDNEETTPAEQPVQNKESSKKKKPAPVEESKPAGESTPPEESAPADEPAPEAESGPAQETAPADESASPEESSPAEEPATPAEPKPKAEEKSAQEPAPADEPAPEAESGPAQEPAAAPSAGGGPVSGDSKPKKKSNSLIDDSEEKEKNDSWDELDTDDTEHKEEEVNYGLLSKEDLVKLMKEKLDNPGKGNIKKEVEDIRRVFYKKVSAVQEEKKKHFLDEGGNIEDFKPVEEPVEMEMKELLHKYKGLKAEFTKQLEQAKQDNLLKKQEILEGFRILMENQESFEVTFRKFKDLQKQWFSAGSVPHQNLKDLWDSYNYFVEKFNDYVRINRDLRALDLKKNLELKEQLCERTEALDKDPNLVHAFKVLQKNHARWREIGPVPRENRDEIWERFKQATSVINKKHQEYHSRLKESLQENLEKKVQLCEKVEQIAAQVYDSHSAWVEKTNQVLEIQKTWKTIGYAPKKDNNIIYARFRTACDVFFGNKAKFYAAAYEDQKDNLKLKLEITEMAENLSKSQDWKETTNELIRLQKKWKEIGPVPRRDSDKLWKRFRAACDKFFNNKSKYFEDIDSTFEENLKAKELIVKEMDEYAMDDKLKVNLDALEDFQSRFNDIGYVPSAKKDWIKDRFRQALDLFLERIGMDETERSIYKFKYRIANMASAPRSEIKLNFERDKLLNKLQQLRNDMGVWENNIGFFKQSDSSEDTIQGYQEKIEEAHNRIEILEKKIRILDDMENEN